MIEIHTHGSKAVVTKLHEVLEKFEDCRIAEPGEFTKIAFQNNKINLCQKQKA